MKNVISADNAILIWKFPAGFRRPGRLFSFSPRRSRIRLFVARCQRLPNFSKFLRFCAYSAREQSIFFDNANPISENKHRFDFRSTVLFLSENSADLLLMLLINFKSSLIAFLIDGDQTYGKTSVPLLFITKRERQENASTYSPPSRLLSLFCFEIKSCKMKLSPA